MANEQQMLQIMEMINQLGGLEKFQKDPFSLIGELFKHPEMLSEIDRLSKTPEMQEQIKESMNNPMFQQMVANNPMLSSMMNQYRQAHGMETPASESTIDVESNEPSAVGYDIKLPHHKLIDWMNPPSMQPFFIPDDPAKRMRFSKIVDEVPEECREKVEILANKRLNLHLAPAAVARLEEIATKYGLTALDLMATQGGFMGELFYCASILMPEDDMCDLAKHALKCLMLRSGYPVASYLTQIILYLDSYDDISKSDWENFVWGLSGSPVPGRDGNFECSWEDACTIAEVAAENLDDEPELFLAVCLGLLAWPVVSLEGVEAPVQTLLDNLTTGSEVIAKKLQTCLDGEKIYSISLNNLRESVRDGLKAYIEENI